MKNKYKILSILIGFLFFVAAPLANASIYEQLDDSHDFSGSTTFTLTTGVLSSDYYDGIDVKVRSSGGCKLLVQIREHVGSTDYTYGDSGDYPFATVDIPADNTYREALITYPQMTAARVSDPDRGKIANLNRIVFASASSFGAGGTCADFQVAGTTAADTGLWSGGNAPYLKINDSVYIGSLPLADDTLVWVAPINETTTTDFRNWLLKANLATYTPDTFYIKINYGHGNTTDHEDTSHTFANLPGIRYDSISISKTNDFSVDTNYWAKACLYDPSNVKQFCTTTIRFDVRGGEKSDFASNNPGTADAAGRTSCGATGFAIPSFDIALGYSFPGIDFGNGICRIATYLFVPNSDTVDAIKDLPTELQTKAPFSIFYDIKGMFESEGTTPGTLGTLTLHGGSNLNYNVDVLSEDTIDKYTGSTTRNLIRSLIQGGLWLGFAFLIVHEGRKLMHKHQ